MDESRKQFEAEMAKLGDCVDMRRAKNGDEEYMEWDVRLAWKMWQASRAAIEIDLPEWFSPHDCGDRAMWSDSVEKAIRAAGIKVKE
ncbi:TPA: hypothetical protein NDY72_000319 [Enterobacter cloacae]|uniref:hypothetical protein n=1 Tax=Enterobacter cloacae TaxID=550 RepID=UPI00211BB0BD|nr:hypothetical protein [Enterobacter cloacae]MCQ9484388.1 hypothetical protein [Enterobacter cloacae]MCQ9527444.1 hypothetical protein [Enterobacter cloacae]MCQ9570081.1 hypothetical protein [Enterobacter cloacae]HCD7173186.1 hypothetical protein [Enterobacter cloacae]HDC4657852.1 hypothetical protein [Enterobacter cloacae]